MIASREEATPEALAREMQSIAERLGLSDPKEALLFPKYFQIETSRICNAHCPFCPVDVWDKSVPLMPDALYDKIVSEMRPYASWIRQVCVQRDGEPLLDKKIVERVRKMKQAGVPIVTMASNVSLLTEDKGRALLEAGLDELMISIDSIDKETYEKMRVGLKYERVIENIRTYFRVRNEVNPHSRIRVRGVSFYDMNREDHRRELERWEAFWSELKGENDRIYMKRAHNWGNQKVWDGRTIEYGEAYHPCIAPWSTMHISAMGIVALCPQDYDAKVNIGDINVQTIAEVWQGENWTRIREQHSSGRRNEISFCRGCHIFDPEFSLENKGEGERAPGLVL